MIFLNTYNIPNSEFQYLSGNTYTITARLYLNSSIDNNGISKIYLKPISIDFQDLTQVVSTTGVLAETSVQQISASLTSSSDVSEGIQLVLECDVAAVNSTGEITDINIQGPMVEISQVLEIEVDQKCSSQEIYLTWLNNLGAWEYWNFTARKVYGNDFGDVKQVRRDVMSNWDADFINGQTVDDYTSIEAFETVTVRSQPLTSAQVNFISSIRRSIKVQQIISEGDHRTILIDKDSFSIREDRQKNHILEFNFRYTDPLPIQTQ